MCVWSKTDRMAKREKLSSIKFKRKEEEWQGVKCMSVSLCVGGTHIAFTICSLLVVNKMTQTWFRWYWDEYKRDGHIYQHQQKTPHTLMRSTNRANDSSKRHFQRAQRRWELVRKTQIWLYWWGSGFCNATCTSWSFSFKRFSLWIQLSFVWLLVKSLLIPLYSLWPGSIFFCWFVCSHIRCHAGFYFQFNQIEAKKLKGIV